MFIEHPFRALKRETPGAHTPQTKTEGYPTEENDSRNDKPRPRRGGEQNASFAGTAGNPKNGGNGRHLENEQRPEESTHRKRIEALVLCLGFGGPNF